MKKNLPLIIGILLPIIFVLIISVVLFGPKFFIKPGYDFIYSTQSSDYLYRYRNIYTVVDGKVSLQPVISPNQNINEQNLLNEPDLYRYDTENYTAHKITLDEAEKLELDPGPSSPDGYAVEYKYSNDGIFELFGSDNGGNGYFITKGSSGKKLPGLTAVNGRYYYRDDIKIIGWIK